MEIGNNRDALWIHGRFYATDQTCNIYACTDPRIALHEQDNNEKAL